MKNLKKVLLLILSWVLALCMVACSSAPTTPDDDGDNDEPGITNPVDPSEPTDPVDPSNPSAPEDDRVYNQDGSLFTGQKHIDGKLYDIVEGVKTQLYSGQYRGFEYINGELFSGEKDSKIYFEGLLFTGRHSDGKVYKRGVVFTGKYIDGKYYKNGELLTGIADGLLYEEGITYSGIKEDTVYFTGSVFNGFYEDGKLYADGKLYSGIAVDDKLYKDGVLVSEEVDGLLYKDGVLVSEEVDGVLYLDGVLFNGYKSGKYYTDGVLFSGEKDNRLYQDGILFSGDYNDYKYLNGTKLTGFELDKLYFDGELFSGTYSDGKYYENGILFSGEYNNYKYLNGVLFNGDSNGKLYSDGLLFNGVEGEKLYQNGELFSGTYSDGRLYSAGVAVEGLNNGKLYVDGKLFNGTNSENGKFYQDGEVFTGYKNNVQYVDGDIVSTVSPGNEDALNFKQDGKLYVGNQLFTGVFGGKAYKNGTLITGVNSDDDKYYVDGQLYTGIKLLDGVVYSINNGVKTTLTGEYDGKYYIDGYVCNDIIKLGDTLYIITNGAKNEYTGVYSVDSKYYMDGKLYTGIQMINTNVYQITNGVMTGINGTYDGKYYVNGELADGEFVIGGILYEVMGGELSPYTGVASDGKYYESGVVFTGIRDIYGEIFSIENGEMTSFTGVYGNIAYENGMPFTGTFIDGKYYDYGELFTGFAMDDENRLYENGLLYTGVYKDDGLFYSNGKLFTGIVDGKLYEDGSLFSGEYANKLYENGSLFTGESLLYGKLYEDGVPYVGYNDGKYYIDGETAKLSDGVQLDGRLYNDGALFSGVYNNLYYSKGLLYTGVLDGKFYADGALVNGIYIDGKLYKNGEVVDGIHSDGKLYEQGTLFTGTDGDGILYVDGLPFTGTYNQKCYVEGKVIDGLYSDGKLYEDGELFTGMNSENDRYYVNGVVFTGIANNKTYTYGYELNSYEKPEYSEDDSVKHLTSGLGLTYNGMALKFIENEDGLYGINIIRERDGNAVYYSDKPAILDVRGTSTQLVGGYSVTRNEQGYNYVIRTSYGYIALAEIVTEYNSVFEVADCYYMDKGAFAVDRTVSIKVAGEGDLGYESVFCFKNVGDKIYNETTSNFDLFLPSLLYKDLSYATAGRIGSTLTGDKIMVKETRMGIPMAYMRDIKTNVALSLFHLEPEINVNGIILGGEDGAVNDLLEYGSIGYTLSSGLGVEFCYPCAEGPQTYDAGLGWARRFHEVKEDGGHTYKVGLFGEENTSYQDSMINAYKTAYNACDPEIIDLTTNKDGTSTGRSIDGILEDNIYLFASVYQEKSGNGGGVPWAIELQKDTTNGNAQGAVVSGGYSAQMGFVGQQTAVAYQMLKRGYEGGGSHLISYGKAMLNFWSSSTIMSNVLPVVWWELDSNSLHEYPAFLRCFVDGMEGMLDGYRIALKYGEDMTQWKDAVLKVGSFLKNNQNPDGSYYRAYDRNGTVSTTNDPTTTVGQSKVNTPVAVRFLAKLYEFTGDIGYKNAALRAADYCYEELYKNVGKYIGGTPDNPNAIDKEASVYALYAFNAAYALTGHEKYLNAAEHAAINFMSWVYTYDFAVPNMQASDDSINCFKNGGTSGFSIISTYARSSADNYSAYVYYEMFKLYVLTGDTFYKQCALLLQNNTKQATDYLGTLGYPYGAMGPEATNCADFSFTTVGTWLPWSGIANIEPITNMRLCFGNADIAKLSTDLNTLRIALNDYGVGGKAIA